MAAASVDDAEALRLQGNDAFTRGDYPEAARLYSASLASRPSAAALSNRSAAHLRLGLRAQALADADACAALDPSFARARLRVAQALQGLHDAAAASEAESALAELLRHTPASDPIIRELRAIADAPERASIFHTAGGATPQPPTGNVSAATGASMEAAYIGFLSADPRRLVALMTLSWGLQHGPQPLPGGMAPPGPVAVHMLAPASTPAVVRVSFMPLCMLQTLAAHPQYKAASSPEEVAATLDQIDKLSRVDVDAGVLLTVIGMPDDGASGAGLARACRIRYTEEPAKLAAVAQLAAAAGRIRVDYGRRLAEIDVGVVDETTESLRAAAAAAAGAASGGGGGRGGRKKR